MPSPPPPPLPDPDRDHLRLLSIFHYVLAGIDLLGLAVLVGHYALMGLIFSNSAAWESAKNPPPFEPRDFMGVMLGFYVVIGALVVGMTVLTLLSGIFIARRRNRMFSMTIAGINCLSFPFGTALGAFTLIVLMRDRVERLYRESSSGVAQP